jgi:prophage tail gpP-like protein
VIGARLYWEDQLWEELSPDRAIKVNTFAGHKWNVKIDNEVVITWVIDEHRISQRFVLSSEDLPIINS